MGEVPDPCKVPLFNLKTREVKIIDFSSSEVGEEVELEVLSDQLVVRSVHQLDIGGENSSN